MLHPVSPAGPDPARSGQDRPPCAPQCHRRRLPLMASPRHTLGDGHHCLDRSV